MEYFSKLWSRHVYLSRFTLYVINDKDNYIKELSFIKSININTIFSSFIQLNIENHLSVACLTWCNLHIHYFWCLADVFKIAWYKMRSVWPCNSAYTKNRFLSKKLFSKKSCNTLSSLFSFLTFNRPHVMERQQITEILLNAMRPQFHEHITT